jgi:XRE family transcriptional regulator, regulator of sulfur utilization
MLTRRGVVLLGLSVVAIFSVAVVWAQTPKKPAMESTVFDWSQIKAEATKYGAKRQIFDGRTGAMERLECHATTLNAGETTHPPRRQPEEELVIVKEGAIEAELNDKPRRVEAGSVLFVAANDLYGVRNPTDAPATYYVIKFSTAAPAAK